MENIKVVSINRALSIAIWNYSRTNNFGISQPSAILMNPTTLVKLSDEYNETFGGGLESLNLNTPFGIKFMGIPIYRTIDVETFKVL